MALIDVTNREIHAKIVYYGPGLSGKTTNLINIHQRLPADIRGKMKTIATETERTLFFDFVPIDAIRVGGWAIRFHLYSVPGQDVYVRTRRAILGGADGVVFVADSDPARRQANADSVAELGRNLAAAGHDPATFPLVIQANKRDLPDALPISELRNALAIADCPHAASVAARGEGVFDTLRVICKLVAGAL